MWETPLNAFAPARRPRTSRVTQASTCLSTTCSTKRPCEPDPKAEASGDTGMAPARVPDEACRINALPEDVLLRVLSYLDAVEVVQTSLLSRRWRSLWRSVPRINVTRNVFNGVADTEEVCHAMFKAFVHRFLMLRNPTALDVFKLQYAVPMPEHEVVDYDAESEDANLWIRHAVQCDARSLRVSVWSDRLHLDSSVFAATCFLNSLKLSRVVLFTGFFNNLQKGCTVLERLSLYDCCINDIDICSQTLKDFTIGKECNFNFSGRVTISIPSLVQLGYFSYHRILPLLLNMESLETAFISVRGSDTPVDDAYQVLRSLSRVANLNFRYKGDTLKVDRRFQWCPKFNNLTILTLGKWCLYGDFYALIVFLQNSPNLVKLSVKLEKSQATDGMFIGDLEDRSFTCEHLKVVEIICSKDSEDNPVFTSLKKLLTENGITSGQIIMR